MPQLRWGATTNPGMVRSDNEDTFVAESMVFAVADGMGGHQAGEVASALAASIVRDRLSKGADSEDYAVAVVNEANAAIYGAARVDASKSGMGTTLTAVAVLKAQGSIPEQLVLLNVGDSRTYRFRLGRLQRVTVDHSYVQELVATGHITMEEARTHPRRNIVTRALGIEPNVRTDMWTLPLVRGDRFILCSDGLVDEVPDPEILDLVSTVEDPQSLSQQLVDLANRHGGRDNVTVVVLDVLDGAEPPDPTGEMPIDPRWAEAITDSAGPPIWAENAPTTQPVPTQPVTNTAATEPMPAPVGAAMGLPTLPPPAAPLPGAEIDESDRPVPVAQPTALASTFADAPSAGEPAAALAAPTPSSSSSGSNPSPSLPPAASMRMDDPAPSPKTVESRPRKKRLTGGLFLFIVVLAAIIIATFTLIAVHARSGYYAGFDGDKVVVFKGQPDGVLWFHPTVERATTYTRGDLPAAVVTQIDQHVVYDSVDEAVKNLQLVVPPTTTTTIAPATTVADTTATTAAATTVPGTTPAATTTTTVPSGP
ncbi:MAG: putative serine/threonine protein phosphatase [Ilumatobacteraceae bacterium]|nr:putative serine/threonine protein phosphatase [Ilumatobacteraceae bacterium]